MICYWKCILVKLVVRCLDTHFNYDQWYQQWKVDKKTKDSCCSLVSVLFTLLQNRRKYITNVNQDKMEVGRYTNQVPSKLRLVRYTEDYISSWCLCMLRNTKYSAVRTLIVTSPLDLTPLLLPSNIQATLQSTPNPPFYRYSNHVSPLIVILKRVNQLRVHHL